MIRAAEAAAISTLSNSNIERILDRLGEYVEQAAKNGDRRLIPEDRLHDERMFDIDCPAYRVPEFNALQLKVVARLRELGYQVQIKSRKVRVGGGLGSMDEESREGTQHYMEISW